MKWFFPPQPQGQVETEVTQRDQFSNDEVELAETIVREAIQNSLDAAVEDPANIKVSFRWLDESDGLTAEFLSEILEKQLEHAEVAGLGIGEIDFDKPTALVIEDFGTSGLTGSVNKKDDDNFSDFWRRHGKSHKSGKSRGRWGLGKLVYSTTSQVGAFFGVTIRPRDANIYIMGQTVLNLRTVNDIEYPPHAFYSNVENEGDLFHQIPVPSTESAIVERFSDQFSLARGNETGLSVIIPFPNPDIQFERILSVAIENYYYPIITGQLKLQFNNTEIDSNNIRELAHKYASEAIDDIDEVFDFIEEAFIADEEDLLSLKPSWADDIKLDENDFDQDTLEQIRDGFSKGKMIGLKLPVEIKHKDGKTEDTSFSVYIKRPEELSRGQDLYVRGGLTLPGESKFRDRKALGVMVAEKEAICAFLGDAENAAHTQWNSTAEKLRKNYRSPQKIVKVIKNALVELYDLLAGVTEEIDEQALAAFFWMEEPEATTRRRRPVRTPLTIPEIAEPRIQDFSICRIAGGFTVTTTNKTTPQRFPQTVRIQMAYNIGRGNPFKKYSAYDFTVGSKDIEIALTKESGKIIEKNGNTLVLNVNEAPFKMQVTGFDVNRDLRVRLNRVD